MSLVTLCAFDGSGIDGGLYLRVVGWAEAAPAWLDGLVRLWSAYGLALFAALMLAGWWRARGAEAVVMARALAVPLVTGAAYLVDELLKLVVAEVRPCRQLAAGPTPESCPAPSD